jgi:hypothetical protein
MGVRGVRLPRETSCKRRPLEVAAREAAVVGADPMRSEALLDRGEHRFLAVTSRCGHGPP